MALQMALSQDLGMCLKQRYKGQINGRSDQRGLRKEDKRPKRPKNPKTEGCTKTGSSDSISSEPVLVGGSLFTLKSTPRLDEWRERRDGHKMAWKERRSA